MPAKKPRKNIKKKVIDEFEPMLVFKDVDISLIVDSDIFTEEDSDRIAELIELASKNICIDKSYVAYEGTKYEKTFFKEEGWNEFKKLLLKTNFGNKCTSNQKTELFIVYNIMIQCYLYQFLNDFGYDSAGICVEVEDGTKYTVEIYNDETRSWEKYPGKW